MTVRRTRRPPPLRGVARTLSVVRALNEHNGARVTDLASLTGISRPSLYRILEGLCALGYLRRRPDEDRYELTIMVRTLSDGFNDESWVRGIAQPIMEVLQRKIIWPTDIATFFANAMFLRATTRRHSPLTIDTATAGLRLPILQTATGRAYLAFCTATEREVILDNLRRSKVPEDSMARDDRYVKSLLARTQKNGYGERQGEIYAGTGAIAVPIRHGDQVLACLNITFIASALSPREAAARYLGELCSAAAAIEEQLKL